MLTQRRDGADEMGMRSSASGSPESQPAAITIVLAHFDDLLAGGLRELIEGDTSLRIVARNIEYPRISVALQAHEPDVAILDGGALEKLSDVRELGVQHPGTRLVLLNNDLSPVECSQLLAFGASACLGRATQGRDVLNAIHLASRGLQLIPRESGLGGGSISGGHLLTRREGEVLTLLQQGRSNPQIALALGIGVETIRTHARNIYRKLGVSSRRELSPPPAGARERAGEPDARPSRRRASARPSRQRRGHDVRHG